MRDNDYDDARRYRWIRSDKRLGRWMIMQWVPNLGRYERVKEEKINDYIDSDMKMLIHKLDLKDEHGDIPVVFANVQRMETTKARDLLRDEFNRCNRTDSPWNCFEHDCPRFKQPMQKTCGCYRDATKAHIAEVLKEINKS